WAEERPRTVVSVPLLDLVAQYCEIKDDVLAAMMEVIERQSFIMGPEVPQLEAEIARLSHTKHGIACASGTDALLLPLKALDLQPGDEVITTPFTFFATAGTVHNAGGTPVFVDIDPATMNISPEAVEAAITPRTRAIIVVHLFGQMAAMESIMRMAAPGSTCMKRWGPTAGCTPCKPRFCWPSCHISSGGIRPGSGMRHATPR